MKRLSTTDLCEAFPEEIEKTVVPHLIRKYRKIIKYWEDVFYQLSKEDYDNDTKVYIRTVIKYIYYPNTMHKQYERLLYLKRFYNSYKSGKLPEVNQDTIDKAKSVPIETLFDFDKMRIKRNQIVASCPFHSDTTPSFVIYKHNNQCHCFSCGFHQDAIGFYSKINGCNFITAVKELTKI